MDESKIENVANNFRKGMNAAADLAEEIGRVAKAKLDVALAKKQIYRAHAELGAFVFVNIEKDGKLDSTEAQDLIKKLGKLQNELEEFETILSELRNSSDQSHKDTDS